MGESKFLRLKCKCGAEQIVFGNASRETHCLSCGAPLTKPTGSRAMVYPEITVLEILE